jgi:hypothetical protein
VTFQGATITRPGLRPKVAIVQSDAATDNVQADRLITALQNRMFGATTAVVLMAQDPQFGPVYYGRADVVRSLENVDVTTITWAEYTLK